MARPEAPFRYDLPVSPTRITATLRSLRCLLHGAEATGSDVPGASRQRKHVLPDDGYLGSPKAFNEDGELLDRILSDPIVGVTGNKFCGMDLAAGADEQIGGNLRLVDKLAKEPELP